MTQANSPGDRRKASDEALERAWHIGWRAALSKGLKGEAAKNFVTSVQQSLIVEPRKKAQGVVLDLALTERARLLRTFADPLGVLMVLLLLFAAGVAASNQDAAGFLLVIIALVAGFVVWIRRFRKWMREAPALLGKLPPSGTAIVANVEGLSVGGTVTPWSQMRVEFIALRSDGMLRSNWDGPDYYIERILLATPQGAIGLDVTAIDGGWQIIETVCANLPLSAIYTPPPEPRRHS